MNFSPPQKNIEFFDIFVEQNTGNVVFRYCIETFKKMSEVKLSLPKN